MHRILASTFALLVIGCAGEDGLSYLTDVSDEPAGANCVSGGARIDSGPDSNGDGDLGASEISDTDFLCAGGTMDESQIVKAFNLGPVVANTNAPVTLVSASITTTGPGKIVAIGTTDTFCTVTECPTTQVPAADGNFWLSSVNNLGIPAADFDYFYVEPNTSESLTRTLYFPIEAAGTHTFYVRGQDATGAFSFYRNALTVVFLP